MQKNKLTIAMTFLFITFNVSAGQNGLPGCDGGTKPSADGKYYKPETHQLCNPVHARTDKKFKQSHH